MKISLPINKQNYLASQYGGYGDPSYLTNGHPLTSFPITWSDFLPESKYVHLILVDYDSNPVCNYTWFHWGVCNLSLAQYPDGIPENLSVLKRNDLNQAINSLYRVSQPLDPKSGCLGYYGPFPPDHVHTYSLYVLTTDTLLPLQNGWMLNQFVFSLNPASIIEVQRLDFKYDKDSN